MWFFIIWDRFDANRWRISRYIQYMHDNSCPFKTKYFRFFFVLDDHSLPRTLVIKNWIFGIVWKNTKSRRMFWDIQACKRDVIFVLLVKYFFLFQLRQFFGTSRRSLSFYCYELKRAVPVEFSLFFSIFLTRDLIYFQARFSESSYARIWQIADFLKFVQ